MLYISTFAAQNKTANSNLTKMRQMKQTNSNRALRGIITAFACVSLLSYGLSAYAETPSGIQAVEQTKTIKGTIVDVSGDPVIGASVLVKGTSKGTVTDIDGNFMLSDISETATLQISYIGYQTMEVGVKGKNVINLTLQEDSESLDEVVVVGYGTMKKSDLTGSVGSVSAQKLSARGTTSVSDALQGSVPGVSITQKNSRAGGGFDIQIRGQASINKQASPLYVIDGVVCSSMDFLNPEDIERIDILKDASSTAIYGSRASAGVIMITTKGSKGAEKAGRVNIAYDGYYGIKKIARMPDFMDAQEWGDFRLARFTTLESTKFDGSTRPGVDADGHPHYELTPGNLSTAFLMRADGTSYRDSKVYEMIMSGSKGYDWTDYVTRTAAQQNHFISANGSTDKVNYRLGMGYQGEENVFKKNDYQRFNVKGSFDAKLTKVFEAGLSTNLAYSKTEDFSTDATYSPYVNAFFFCPFVSPYDENGNLLNNPGSRAAFGSNSQFTSTVNPLIDLLNDNYQDQTKNFTAMANVYLRANITPDLHFTTTYSPNFSFTRHGVFYGTGITDEYPNGSNYYQRNGTNSATAVNTHRFDWTWDNQLDFAKTLGNHSINAMALFSLYRSYQERYEMKGFGISDDYLKFYAMDKASGDKNIESSYTENRLVSWAGRLNYSYKGKYMATATVRTDGSSRFADGNRWGWFPSLAVAWRASEESFLKQYDWLDNLKLRLSYGLTGNNNVGDYVTVMTASGPTYVALNGAEVQGYFTNGLVNTNLIWEKVKEFDFGFDLGVFKNRLNLTADYYLRLSDGQIMDRLVPIETGETSSTFNVGSVRNTGFEISLTGGIIRTKDFQWDVTVNFSRNWNEILELSNGKVDEVASNRFIGKPLNSLRGYTHTEVITDQGVTMHTIDGDIHYTLKELYDKYGKQYKWYEGQVAVNDWNNDGKISDEDKQIFGCTDPKWTGSISSTMYFKGFDFSFMIYTKQGQWSRSYFHDQYGRLNRAGQSMSFDYYIPKGAPMLDRTTGDIVYATETHYGSYPYPTNADTTWGGYFGSSGSAKEEGFQYQKTSFVKVKNITFGYTLPKKATQAMGIQRLRAYVNVLNPFCFTDYEGFDPEWASATLTNGGPASVTYQFGVNLSF